MRSDKSFRNRVQPQHHNQQELVEIEKLPINMINQIGLDYMHVVCLGVTKTLLKSLVRTKGEHYSLPSWHIILMSTKLKNFKNQVPYEFYRKPRSLDDLERWKATELRQFLLYYGPVILQSILSPERFLNFLNLSLGLRILLQKDNCVINKEFAKNLLHNFVKDVPQMYNLSLLTCNFHCLLHIHEDAKAFGSLENVSAFRFENHLQQIKQQVRKASHVSTQIYNRIVEKSYTQKKVKKRRK